MMTGSEGSIEHQTVGGYGGGVGGVGMYGTGGTSRVVGVVAGGSIRATKKSPRPSVRKTGTLTHPLDIVNTPF